LSCWYFNPLAFKGNYSATSNNTKLVHRPLMGGLLHLVQRGGDWAGPQPAQAPPHCTKCNSPPIQCTNHCILYNGVLLCSFDVGNKGLKVIRHHRQLVSVLTSRSKWHRTPYHWRAAQGPHHSDPAAASLAPGPRTSHLQARLVGFQGVARSVAAVSRG